jgi:hypothetical protein
MRPPHTIRTISHLSEATGGCRFDEQEGVAVPAGSCTRQFPLAPGAAMTLALAVAVSAATVKGLLSRPSAISTVDRTVNR